MSEGEVTITRKRYEKYQQAEIDLEALIAACDIEGHHPNKQSACFICTCLFEIGEKK